MSPFAKAIKPLAQLKRKPSQQVKIGSSFMKIFTKEEGFALHLV